MHSMPENKSARVYAENTIKKIMGPKKHNQLKCTL